MIGEKIRQKLEAEVERGTDGAVLKMLNKESWQSEELGSSSIDKYLMNYLVFRGKA